MKSNLKQTAHESSGILGGKKNTNIDERVAEVCCINSKKSAIIRFIVCNIFIIFPLLSATSPVPKVN